MIKAFIFDIGGVVAISHIDEVHSAIAARFGLGRKKVADVYWGLYYDAQRGTGQRAFWRSYAKGLGIDSPEELKAAFTGSYRNWKIGDKGSDAGVVSIIGRLRENGYRVVALSNTTHFNEPVHRKLGHYDHFDRLFLSNRLKMAKPDKAIFLHCMKKLNARPGECVFIDDSKENVKVARGLGMHGIRFMNAERLDKEIKDVLRRAADKE